MSKFGGFSSGDLKGLQKELNKLQGNTDAFVQACAKELAARLLARVIKRTPVGDYSKEVEVAAKRDSKNHKKGDTYKKRINPNGKMGGTLRRGWTQQSSGSGTEGLNTNGAAQYVDTLKINHFGDTYVIEIVNPVEYASYVEFGHRTRNHKGWVKGRFMMTISCSEIETIAPKVLEQKIQKFLGGAFS